MQKVVLGVRDEKELAKAAKRLEDNGLSPPSQKEHSVLYHKMRGL